ncbi:MAG: CsgG/HfaB family protein [Candidatus Marinimicrobia bacterium]|nr:CsgG/HfaB family protein [Candidatus Neomarinimicrobiota bacterium]
MKRIYRFIPIFFASLILAQVDDGSQAKPTAAVLDFEGSGITTQEAQVLTQRLGSELVQTNALIMVERNQMSEIMDEQGFQQAGCTSAECAAEIGALLGVQKMITGSFGKIGNSYTIEARMFSVESGKTEKTVSKTYKGEVDGLLTEIQVVAWELVGLQPPADLLAKAGIAAPAEEVAEEKPKKKGGSKWFRNTLIILLLAGGGAYAAMQAGGDADLPEPPEPPTSGGAMFMIGGGK